VRDVVFRGVVQDLVEDFCVFRGTVAEDGLGEVAFCLGLSGGLSVLIHVAAMLLSLVSCEYVSAQSLPVLLRWYMLLHDSTQS